MGRRTTLLPALVAALALVLVPAAGAFGLSEPPPFAAEAALVTDGRTGEVLFAKGADRRLPMASITKVMTAVVVLEHARPGDVVTVSPVVADVGESSVYLTPGERLTVRELLAAILVQSANDAAFALAAHVADGDVDRFVRLMNRKARELGLSNTRYARPDGLDVPRHYSSARDTVTLARHAMEQPLVRELVRKRRATIAGGRRLFGWNDLLGTFPGRIGVKTGHTAKAGWCQVAAARRDGALVYGVVLGSPSRAKRNAGLARLLEWGLGRYDRLPLVEEGRVYASAVVPFADEPLDLVAAEGAEAVVRVDRSLVERVRAPAAVELPVADGEPLGEVRVYAGGRLVSTRPLVASRAVEEPNLRERARWYARRTVSEAGSLLEAALGGIL